MTDLIDRLYTTGLHLDLMGFLVLAEKAQTVCEVHPRCVQTIN